MCKVFCVGVESAGHTIVAITTDGITIEQCCFRANDSTGCRFMNVCVWYVRGQNTREECPVISSAEVG